MSAAKLLPRHHDEFRSKEYWDTFFRERTDAFEWYGEYHDLLKLVHLSLRRTDRILVVGCGNSNFSAELYDDGFEEIENVDFSQPVVAEMCRAHSGVRPRMAWRVMDVTDMHDYDDGSFDAVVDKGTLDALMSEDTVEVRNSGTAMLREVARVLKPGGRYMCVTLWQDFIGSTFLASFARAAESGTDGSHDWTLDLHAAPASTKPSPYLPLCIVATKKSSGSFVNGDGSLGKDAHEAEMRSTASSEVANDQENGDGAGQRMRVAAWCDKAGRPLGVAAEPYGLHGELEVLAHVRQAQQMHRRRYDLREIRPGRFEQEDLWGEGNGESPRFTFLIVDHAGDGQTNTLPCAVVLIPRGRDRDFTFSSLEGLQQVADSANARRVIAVRLNRGHEFSDGVEGVKTEISPVVSDFAPEASAADVGGPGIPIMAVSDGLGVEGRLVAKGELKWSGRFVIEEEEEDDDEEGRPAGMYRRLIFLKNEGVVQTEVRMLGEGEDDGVGSSAGRKPSSKKGKGKGKGSKGKKKSPPSAKRSTAGGVSGVDQGGPRVDSGHLCFEFHRCMVAGASLADLRGGASAGAGDGRAPTSLVIGLGGGALPMALCRMYPGMKVLAVEIDPEVAVVAQEHFGLKESDSLKVVVEDGLSFVKAAAAASPAAACNGKGGGECLAPSISKPMSPALPHSTETLVLESTTGNITSNTPTYPTEADAVQAGEGEAVAWGGAFGPPYSAIFVDVDNKDTTVGMSCPPAAFLDFAFLNNIKMLLVGGAETGVGTGRYPGVLAVNVAARSKELFGGAVDAICAAFPDGEVHKLRAGADAVNSVLLALPRPRGKSKAGPLYVVAEEALASATVNKRAIARILEASERAEAVKLGRSGNDVTFGAQAGQAAKGGKRRGKR